MSEKFKGKYHIDSIRLKNWDYSWPGMYFVTATMSQWQCEFGRIENEELILNDLGLFAYNQWLKTPELRTDMNLELGEFVVMPNHFHGIIIINPNPYNLRKEPVNEDERKNSFGPQSKNLAAIMRGFKGAITSYAKKQNREIKWMYKFYDHIIRSHEDYLRIAEYIANNPKNWGKKKLKNILKNEGDKL